MKKYFKLKDVQSLLILSLLLVILLIALAPIIGIPALAVFLYIAYHTVKGLNAKNQENKKYLEQITDEFDTITKKAIFNMPFPLVITDQMGKVIWYNPPFLNLFPDEELMDKDIQSLISDINVDEVLEVGEKATYEVKMKGRQFVAYPNVVDVSRMENDREHLLMMYFVDNTSFFQLEKKYVNESAIIAKIEVDNFNEALDTVTNAVRPQLIVEIDTTIRNYFEEYDAFVRKVDDELYLVVMDFKSLKAIKKKRFDILDDLRELDRGNTIPITLSIGVCSFGLSLKESYDEASTCLDLALGRGGDQVVVKTGDNYEFFGGKSKAVEKRNKVKARVLGIALKQLIDRTDDVFIMGHQNADMDAIGAAIGVLRAAINRNKEGYIVLEASNPSIDNLLRRMEEEEPDLYKKIVSKEWALNNIKQGSLLIMVDNHKPSFTECPELVEKANQIVVIDHHRRGKEFVEDPVLTYVEPYASSTCELITEMLTYMSEDLNLTHFEADALMSGIVVDTKNFSFQTGVRTFEAASILRRAGADMIKVKTLFQDDLDTLLYRAEVVHNTKIVHDNIAISSLEREAKNSILIAAQSADELLDINGVDASFVLTLSNKHVHISGRSRGEVISVQLILEKLGGGGHLNMAGAQIETEDIKEAEKMLRDAIDQYFEEYGGKEKE